MKVVKSFKSLSCKSLSAVFMTLAIFCFAGMACAQETGAKATLTSADCVKCHAKPPADIAANGGAHKTNVTCQDCHIGHPPTVKKIIPECSMCHEGKPHFGLKGCLSCHTNPHTPKIIKFGNNVTDPCLTCHTPQIEKLRKYKSKHSALNCSFCHNVHGRIPLCTQCHKPHSQDMTATDCKKCHQAHMPLVVTYGADTQSKLCGSCHKKAYDLLNASPAKHKSVLCVTCHQSKHKMIPKCQDCHGVPHPAGMMAKFPKCGMCHNIAHDLNHWPAEKAPESPAPHAVKKPAIRKR